MIIRAIHLFLAAAPLAMLTGCVVLPVPNCRVEGLGVASQVVDAETGRPISGARVADVHDQSRAVVTNANGRFKLDPHVQWHFGYQYGVIGYPIWPFTGDRLIPGRSVLILAPGYADSEFTLYQFATSEEGENIRGGLPVDGEVLLPPSLPIRKRAISGSPK